MTPQIVVKWFAVVFLAGFASAPVAGALDDSVTVVLIDYAGRPPKQLAAARVLAERLLGYAGIRTSWKVCSPESDTPSGLPCVKNGPLTLTVRVLPAKLSKALKISGVTCGAALTGQKGERARLALVDASCVDRIVDTEEQKAALIGHLMAHEIGHVLLGNNTHSEAGLMAGTWDRDQLLLVVRGDLAFREEEAIQLQEAVQKRALEAAMAGQTPAGR